MRKTKKEIIEETTAFYSKDPSRRAIINGIYGSECQYSTPDGKMCAFGRCMKNPDHPTDKQLSFNREESVLRVKHDSLLKEQYRGHSNQFWLYIQDLHDGSENWTKSGLSVIGKQYVDSLLKIYKE